MLYINYPSWIHPEIIRGMPIRWYGLMYIVAFGITFFLMKKQIEKKKLSLSSDNLSDIFFWTILGLIIGARVFAVTIYDPSGRFLRQPWLIFWPFDENMNFTGIQGMSYHGGVVGAVIAGFIYSRIKKQSFLLWVDLASVSIPLGYTFGRLGNFINGELYGRVSSSPWAMIFPQAQRFSTKLTWVIERAQILGLEVQGNFINLPRHPSQLYEAIFEGLVLWIILWFFVSPRIRERGTMLGYYLIGYGFFRFFIEYFREPDSELGYILELGRKTRSIHELESYLSFSMGQILCLIMLLSGIFYIYFLKAVSKKRGK